MGNRGKFKQPPHLKSTAVSLVTRNTMLSVGSVVCSAVVSPTPLWFPLIWANMATLSMVFVSLWLKLVSVSLERDGLLLSLDTLCRDYVNLGSMKCSRTFMLV